MPEIIDMSRYHLHDGHVNTWIERVTGTNMEANVIDQLNKDGNLQIILDYMDKRYPVSLHA